MKKIGKRKVTIFKMKNRRGYAAVCSDCLTEGRSATQAFDRMVKAISRIERKVLQKDKK